MCGKLIHLHRKFCIVVKFGVEEEEDGKIHTNSLVQAQEKNDRCDQPGKIESIMGKKRR